MSGISLALKSDSYYYSVAEYFICSEHFRCGIFFYPCTNLRHFPSIFWGSRITSLRSHSYTVEFDLNFEFKVLSVCCLFRRTTWAMLALFWTWISQYSCSNLPLWILVSPHILDFTICRTWYRVRNVILIHIERSVAAFPVLVFWVILCWGCCPGHCSISGIYSLAAHSISVSQVWQQNVSMPGQLASGDQNCPWLRITDLEYV